MHDITVSVQEEEKECVGGGSPDRVGNRDDTARLLLTINLCKVKICTSYVENKDAEFHPAY